MRTTPWKKALRNPLVVCLGISLLVFGAVWWVQSRGAFQRSDFTVHDHFVYEQAQRNRDAKDDRIAIVGMTEADLVKYGFPLSDEYLLKLLQTINAQEPSSIGLDLYRDLPEPRIRVGTPFEAEDQKRFAKFCEDLRAIKTLVVLERMGVVKPPPAFAEVPDQVSANNLPKDYAVDGVYRRAPLFVNRYSEAKLGAVSAVVDALHLLGFSFDFTQQRMSFSLALVCPYLDQHNIPYSLDPDPSAPPGGDHTLLRLGKVTFPRLTDNAGPYVDAKIQDYEYMAEFRGPHSHRVMDRSRNDDAQNGLNTPYDYSFGEVLEGKLPAGTLKGKIVFVATVMPSIKDSNPTPIHENLRGVEYHAMLVNQLLDAAINGRAPLRWWSDGWELVWIAGCTLAGGLMGLWLRSPLKLVPALALTLGGIYFGAWYEYQQGMWILVAAPAVGCLLAAALITSYIVALERADRRAVQTILGKHVSKKVAETLLQQADVFLAGGKMPPRSNTVTVIFTDLAGFSTASEKLSPEQTLRWLNEYMEVMVGLVERYDGSVNKFIGDAIMAVFGAPLASSDPKQIAETAAQAVQCALEMRREVPILNERWQKNSPDLPPVAMRVGVFTGELVHGSMGTSDRMEWTVIGDTVNRANRLEAAGKEIKDQLSGEEKLCSILIGPETFERVGHLFVTEPVPNMALKGISERVTVYRVLSERAPQATTTK